MLDLEKNFKKLLLYHLFIGVLAYLLPKLFIIYPFIILIYGVKLVNKTHNRNHEALYFAAYFVGMECFLRMTESIYFYETGKYGVIIFMILGIVFRKFSGKAAIFIILIILFLPCIVTALPTFGEDAEVRKALVFNLLGPFALLFSSIYCYERNINSQQLKNIFLSLFYPLISTLIFIIIFTPKESRINLITESNYKVCGGYGPNQVSTILGLAAFICFSMFLLFAKNIIERIFFLSLLIVFTYRCMISYSRGGLIGELLMIFFLILLTYFKSNLKGKLKIQLITMFLILSGILLFSYSIIQTDGMILKRFTGKNSAGIQKTDITSGRGDLAIAEFQVFLQNPIFGVGVGNGKQARAEIRGGEAGASHNEITRLIAEQGVFGVFIILFLFFIPLIHFAWNRNQFFIIPFFLFWFITINHAAIRIAAPAFIYGLSLLKINFNEE